MHNDKIVCQELLWLVRGGHAHMDFFDAAEKFPMAKINEKFPHGEYGPWALLEHIRLTQADIVEFVLDKNYKEKEWPKDYWPDPKKVATKKDWNIAIAQFGKNQAELEKIVQNSATDLFAKIPWGDGQTIMREILLICDHNAYHIGEFAIMRQIMQTWDKGRR